MPKVQRFEDLRCWQSARELVKIIFLECNNGKLSKDFGTQDQLKRAGISIMNNIAEGFSRFNKKDFIHFLDYAQSSASEVISLTYTLEDIQYLSHEKCDLMRINAIDSRSQILALIKHIKKQLETTTQ